MMVNQLAELLRFSLDSGQGGLVPLEREMKIVEDYLAIEQTRFGERLRYSIHIEAGFGPYAHTTFSRADPGGKFRKVRGGSAH